MSENFEKQVGTPEEATEVMAATLVMVQKDAGNPALQIVNAKLIPCYEGTPLQDGQPIPSTPVTGHLVRFTIR